MHPDFAHDLGNYATLLYRLGDLQQARSMLERAEHQRAGLMSEAKPRRGLDPT